MNIKLFLFREQLSVICRYYSRLRFALLDLFVAFCTLFFNPYRVCRKFLERRGESNIYAYGETPITAFAHIAQAANLSSQDHYIELGSGRGKTCYWAALWTGCRVTGIEWIPFFVRFSRLVAALFRLNADFKRQSIAEADLSGATVVYLYLFDIPEALSERLLQMPEKSRLITISEPFDSSAFECTQIIPLHFPWGSSEAYLHRRKK